MSPEFGRGVASPFQAGVEKDFDDEEDAPMTPEELAASGSPEGLHFIVVQAEELQAVRDGFCPKCREKMVIINEEGGVRRMICANLKCKVLHVARRLGGVS